MFFTKGILRAYRYSKMIVGLPLIAVFMMSSLTLIGNERFASFHESETHDNMHLIPADWLEAIYIPSLTTSISVVSVDPAASGTPGNSDVVVRYTIKNDGPDSANCVQIEFDLVGQVPPFVGVTGSLTATLGTGGVFGPTIYDPTDVVYTGSLSAVYNGGSSDSLFAGKINLAPNQCIAIDIPFELGDTNVVDPILISGNVTGVDTAGNPFMFVTAPFTLVSACESESLACAGKVNVSLGPDCQAVIGLNSVFLNTVVDPNRYTVVVFDGDVNLGNVLDESHVGKDLRYSVLDGCFGGRASCWGDLNLENKNIPQGRFTKQTIYCGEAPQAIAPLEEIIEELEMDCYVELTNFYELYSNFGDKCDTIVRTRTVFAEWNIDGWKTVDTVHVDSILQLPLQFELIENPRGGPDKEDAISVDCDSVGPDGPTPAFLEEYFNGQPGYEGSGVAFAYPYIDRGTITMEMYETRDTIVFDTVRTEIQVDSVWVFINVIEKDTITVTDTIMIEKPNLVPLTIGTTCNWDINYRDDFFPGCNGDEGKILRKWAILDWCEGEFHYLDQWIIIEDRRGPDVEAADTINIGITPWLCVASIQLEAEVTDNCSDVRGVNWMSSAGIIDSNNVLSEITVTDSPVSVILQAVDECGNETLDTIIINVIDSVAPVVVTKDMINTTIIYDPVNERGIAKVTVESLNQDSHDSGCGEIYLCTLLDEEYNNPIRDDIGQLVRDEDGNILYHAVQCEVDGFYDGQPYVICRDAIKLCCDQVGEQLAVVLAEDGSPYSPPGVGWTIVNVEDKSFPIIDCNDIIATCGSDLDPEVIGFPVFSSGLCNSGGLTYEDESEIGDCGEGTIRRTWFVDGDSTCVQTITLAGEDSFDPNSIRWPVHFDDGVVSGIIRECINDTLVESSGNIPMGSSFICDQNVVLEPVWCTTDCGSVFMTYEDTDISDGIACKKIIRKWSVIDWCTYAPNGGEGDDDNDTFEAVYDEVSDLLVTTEDREPCEYCDKPSSQTGENKYFRYTEVDVDGYYTFDQIIKVTDDTDPIVEAPDSVVVEVTGGATSKDDTFEECYAMSGDITAHFRDLCGDLELESASARWNILILDEDGVALDSTVAFGDSATVTGIMADGNEIRTIRWEASDGCGNSAYDETIVEFRDIVSPVSLCIAELSSTTMVTGGVTIWASDFNRGSFDNCGPVSFHFKNDEGVESSSMTFTCDDIENGISTVEQIKVYVEDIAGNETFCYVSIQIDDNNDICIDSAVGSASITGNIMTAKGDMIEAAQVFLNGQQSHVTNVSGTYAFTDVPMAASYMITGLKNDDHLNGVSTLDLVLIQRHILALDTFDTALKTFAADINNDQRVSAIDLVQLRRLLLGITADFPNNESWRFVDPEQQFASLFNPWPLREELVISNLLGDMENQNLVGVKVGDISGNVIANSLIGDSRDLEKLKLSVNDQLVNSNEEVRIPISIEQSLSLGAMQFTLELNDAELLKIESANLEVSEDQYAMMDNNTISFAWTDPFYPEVGGELFTIVLKSYKDQNISEAISMNSSVISARAYDQDANQKDLGLTFTSEELNASINEFIVYQNEPNPFSDQTTIGFVLPEEGSVTISVFDISGRVVFTKVRNFAKGYNEFQLNEQEISSRGVLYYRLQASDQIATRKMILLD